MACVKQSLAGVLLSDRRQSEMRMRILTAWAQDTSAALADRQH